MKKATLIFVSVVFLFLSSCEEAGIVVQEEEHLQGSIRLYSNIGFDFYYVYPNTFDCAVVGGGNGDTVKLIVDGVVFLDKTFSGSRPNPFPLTSSQIATLSSGMNMALEWYDASNSSQSRLTLMPNENRIVNYFFQGKNVTISGLMNLWVAY